METKNLYNQIVNEFKVEKISCIEKDPKTDNSFRTLRVPKIIWEELAKLKNISSEDTVLTTIDNKENEIKKKCDWTNLYGKLEERRI